jgi:hypothetical protein
MTVSSFEEMSLPLSQQRGEFDPEGVTGGREDDFDLTAVCAK